MAIFDCKSRFYNYCRNREQIEDIDDYSNIIEDTKNLVDVAIYLSKIHTQLMKKVNKSTECQKKLQ